MYTKAKANLQYLNKKVSLKSLKIIIITEKCRVQYLACTKWREGINWTYIFIFIPNYPYRSFLCRLALGSWLNHVQEMNTWWWLSTCNCKSNSTYQLNHLPNENSEELILILCCVRIGPGPGGNCIEPGSGTGFATISCSLAVESPWWWDSLIS